MFDIIYWNIMSTFSSHIQQGCRFFDPWDTIMLTCPLSLRYHHVDLTFVDITLHRENMGIRILPNMQVFFQSRPIFAFTYFNFRPLKTLILFKKKKLISSPCRGLYDCRALSLWDIIPWWEPYNFYLT